MYSDCCVLCGTGIPIPVFGRKRCEPRKVVGVTGSVALVAGRPASWKNRASFLVVIIRLIIGWLDTLRQACLASAGTWM